MLVIALERTTIDKDTRMDEVPHRLMQQASCLGSFQRGTFAPKLPEQVS